jgi:hypothetical protein
VCEQFVKKNNRGGFVRARAYHGLEESEDEATAQQQLVALVEQVLDDGQLAGDLRAADHCSERAGRLVQVEELQLLLHQQAHCSVLHEPGHARGGGVRAVGRSEGIVDVHVAQIRQLAAERLVVGLLARVEAHVLEEQH